MDARQFLAEFGHIANAPEGVQRLREMILSLAVRGKLIQLSYPWHECTLGSLGDWAIGCGFSKQEQGRKDKAVLFAKVSDMNRPGNEKFILNTENTITADTASRLRIKIHPAGTVIFPKIGGAISTNKRRILTRPTAIDNNCLGLIPKGEITSDWLFLVLSSIYFAGYQVGTSVPALSQGTLGEIPCFLPSVVEQSRIVAKVDELMALCDKLEAQQQERVKLEETTCKAVLRELTSIDAVSVSSGWERLDRNLDCLFGTPESVDDFEASLKELAVRGVLTPATAIVPDIPPIIQACTELRDRYIADKWMRKRKLVLASDSPVEYPSNWVVVPFDEVAVVIGGVTKGRNMKGRNVMTCPYLSVANVQRGFFKLEKIKTIEIAVEELGKYRVEDDDLLLTEGGDWDKVGRTAIWRGSVENCVHQNHVFKARVPSDQLLNEWVELVFNSNVGRDYFAGVSKQTTNLASINMTQLRSFPFPIPPLAEQKAILKKLSAMTASCKTWRSQRERAQRLSSLLAAASVSAITGIRTEEVEELKVPKTELISKLCLGATPNIKEQAPLAAILTRQNGELAAKDLWQRFGGEIDAFYSQLKLEIGNGWILEPAMAEMQVRDI